jgi:pimeloyl-ACP methyl ester carboxylesterase
VSQRGLSADKPCWTKLGLTLYPKNPVLVLAGRYDRVFSPRFSLQFKKYAPRAQFVMFEHSGHFTFMEESDAFSPSCDDSWNRVPRIEDQSDQTGGARQDRLVGE